MYTLSYGHVLIGPWNGDPLISTPEWVDPAHDRTIEAKQRKSYFQRISFLHCLGCKLWGGDRYQHSLPRVRDLRLACPLQSG